jgi:rare lipoprotein A
MRTALSVLFLFTIQFGLSDATQAQTAHGKASFYSHGQKTASGERFHPSEMTAAHRTLPFNTRVRVTHARTKRSVVVRINDRGPFIRGRIIDVSRGAAQALGMLGQGVAQVELQVIR